MFLRLTALPLTVAALAGALAAGAGPAAAVTPSPSSSTTASPVPSATDTSSPTAAPSPAGSATGTPVASPVASPAGTGTPSAAASATAAAATLTPTPAPTDTSTASSTVTAAPTATDTAGVTPTATPSPAPTAVPVTGYGPGTLTAITVPVQDTGRTSRQVWVWLPPGVTDSPTLPVVYLLHGQYETPRTPFAHGIANVLTDAFAGGLPPFELVVPDGVSAARGDDEWADAWDGADHLEWFVGQATIAAAEGANLRPRSLRAIMGFSMGGYGAAVIAARQWPEFGQYVGLASYYHLDDPQGAIGPNPTYRYVHTPLARADQYDHTRMLLLDCSADATAPVFAGDIWRMRAALASNGHAPGARITAGSHDWSWATAQLPFAVYFLTQGWGRG